MKISSCRDAAAKSDKAAAKKGQPLQKPNATEFPLKSPKPSNVAFLVFQMLLCLLGINVCFGWWSVKQERLIKKPYQVFVPHSHTGQSSASSSSSAASRSVEELYLSTTYGITLSQTLTGFVVSAALLGFSNVVHAIQSARRDTRGDATTAAAAHAERKAKLTTQDVPELLAMGLSNLFGSTLGYAAMRRLSFPVSLTAKMAKMLPVMLVGSVWYGTRYPLRKVVSCFLITGGVISFALLDQRPRASSAKPRATASSSSWLGMGLMVVNLLMDGYTSSTQDVLVKRHRWGGVTLMLWTNLVSVLCAVVVLATLECGEQPWQWLITFAQHVFSSLSGGAPSYGAVQAKVSVSLSMLPFHDFSHFIGFLARCPEARNDVLLMSVLNALGQLFIFQTISVFGTLALTAMTLLRKVGSVVLSIYVHGHTVHSSQWAALSVIFLGVVSEGYVNIQDASKRQQQSSAAASPVTTRELPAVAAADKREDVSKREASSLTPSSSSSTAMLTHSRSTTPVVGTFDRTKGRSHRSDDVLLVQQLHLEKDDADDDDSGPEKTVTLDGAEKGESTPIASERNAQANTCVTRTAIKLAAPRAQVAEVLSS